MNNAVSRQYLDAVAFVGEQIDLVVIHEGDCVVTILLAEEDKVEDDAIFYLIFSGSTLYHCTSTRKVSSDTLETIAPGHDCCETVKVLLCASREGLPVFVVAEEDFHFVQDEAYDAAQFLATSAGNQQALNFTRFLDRSGPPSGDVNSLDERVALAFRHLKLPAEWNVLGTDHTLHDGGPRETLMHFAVRLGLLRLTWFLLQKPGGRGALSIHNKEGATPVSLALERGYHKLHQLLTEENAGEPDSWRSLSYEIPYGDCSVRHHRELDVYTLTSESGSHHEPHGDSCTGHIFKLMNIQQQLMKTNLKQMDNLMPLMVTAQDSSSVLSAPETDGQFLSCAPEPSDQQPLSSEETSSTPCCRGSPEGKAASSCDLSSVAEEENAVCTYKKNKDVERKGEEEEPASAMDTGSASHQDSCLQSTPDCGVKGSEGLPSCGNRTEVTGTKDSVVATGQQSLSSSGHVLQEDMVTEPGACQHSSGRELLDSSSTVAGAPVNAGEQEHSLLNPNGTIQKNKHQVGEVTKERLENSDVSTAEESGVEALHEPVEKANITNHVIASSVLGANMLAESSPALSPGEIPAEKTGKETQERSCEERTDALSEQSSLVSPPAAEDTSGGLAPDTPLADLCETPSPLALTCSGPKPVGIPNQESESNSCHAASPNSQELLCSTGVAGTSCAESSSQQNTVTPSGELVVQHCCGKVNLPESTGTQPKPCTTLCPEDSQADTVTCDTVKNTQESVGTCPLCVLDAKSQGKDLKQDPTLNVLGDVSHLPSVVQTEKEPVPDQVSPPGSSFSLASGPESESVTKDDALSLVPSQKEKGTATPQLHRAIACGDGPDEGDSSDPGKLGDGATGLCTPSAVELQPSMGNLASPVGLGGEQEGPGPTATPEVLSGDSLQSVDKAALVSESLQSEEGSSLVVPENSATQGQDDKGEARRCSSVKEDGNCSEMSRENQITTPPGQEITRVCEQPMSAICAGEKALQPSHSAGTPSAGLKTESKHNKEVATQVSPLTEGGAAKNLVPPKASLAADSKQKVSGAEQSSSSLLSDASEALQPSALDASASAQIQGETNACVVSRNVMEDGPVPDALSAVAETRRKATSHCIKDSPVSELFNEEKKMTPSLPQAFLGEGVTGSQEGITPEIVPLDCKREKLEGTNLSRDMNNSKEAPDDEETMQPLALELPTEIGLSALNDSVLPQTSVQESNATSLLGIQAASVPKGADPIEETATRIVEAVIKQVKASSALLAKGETSSPSLPIPETKQLQHVCTESTCTFPPGETLHMDNTHEEITGNCVVETEEPEKIVSPVDKPEPAPEMPDTKAEDEVDFLNKTRAPPAQEVVGNGTATPTMKQGPGTQAAYVYILSLLHLDKMYERHKRRYSLCDISKVDRTVDVVLLKINRESWCTIEPCPEAASLLASKQSSECESFLDDGLGTECASKEGVLQRGSGSDPDLFHSPSDEMDSIIFSKPEEEQLLCDSTGSSSSTDDAASLDRHSSHGSDVSLPQTSKLDRSRNHQGSNGFSSHGVGPECRESESEPAGSGEMEEEEMDSITEVPANRSFLRSSMRSLSPFRRHSWGPGKNAASDAEMNQRSFSLEGLTGGAGVGNKPSSSLEMSSAKSSELRNPFSGKEQRDSLMSLSEEHLEPDQRQHHRVFDQQTCHRSKQQGFNYCTSAISSPLTKSISLMTISHPGLDNSRSFHSTSANLTESITEENYNFLPPSPSKKDFEGKSGTKVSRTFSYIKNKMSSSKKSKEKEREKDKIKEKEKDSKEKEKDKKTLNGHTFSSIPVVGPISCSQCMKPFTNKEAYTCASCSAFVHKGCRENLASCAKVKMKQPKGSLQAHDTSSLPTVIMRNKSSQPKERPRSAVLLPDEATAVPMFTNRRSQQCVSLSKSVSIQNITGVGNDENMSNTWKFLSHSTDSLNKICKVNESTESLTDEGVGTDMNEGQLMGDFESDSKQLEAESWSRIVDSKFLKQQKKDVVKRQEVIYELMQTELHHIRTLKIMSDVYSRGMMTDLLFEQQMVEKLFPCLDELISIHSQFFQRILERKKESLVEKSERNFLVKRIGDVLVNQFSGENAERLKKTYGKFCGQHNQSVNYFKDLYTKDKRFQAFVKKKMSSSVVRRLGIPECILLVTQRITKYPVLFQRILQCTKDNEVEQEDLAQSLSLVKDVIGAVDSKVASYEKKVRLGEIYTKTDSKSIMRMKSGQMFAKEDLKRKKLVRDGSVFLKSATGRLKEVQAVLLTDILVFLQEKDQKYVFASLDHKSTVISLKKLIVREVAHEEKGLFLISMGVKDPEMVEVHASSKEERNSWIHIIQDTINSLNRDEDEGIPSENEEEKKLLDTRARELKEQLQQKDQQILLLLEEKEMIFRDMTECSTPLPEDCSPTHSPRVLFRSNTEEALKGGPLMKSAISEVEILQGLVSGSLGGTLGQTISSPVEQEVMAGPVSLPRRAETFGGFDCHQMNASKGGEKEEGDDGQDLRRTESDSGLKKQVVQSIVHLHELLSMLQGVVLQQDSYIEDQKLVLTEKVLTRSASRPSSLIEQEKQRSLEKQRQDLANLQKQQAQHLEEKRRREREWEAREQELRDREAKVAEREEAVRRRQQDLERDREDLQQKKGTYQCDLERLRAAQKQLEREQEQLKRDAERLSQRQMDQDFCQVSDKHGRLMRVPSFLPNPEESSLPSAPSLTKSGSLDSELSVSPKRNSISRTHKDKGPFHILSSTGQTKVPEGQSQAPSSTSTSTRLFGLAKPKEKKEKKKKSKGSRSQPGGELSTLHCLTVAMESAFYKRE
ncbi:A-kinase anchor protein 13 [Microtus ochrogaster]|uniref:A-kinase anchor protein 13 n=1 Tax=Microtus ochrogaster TaxID=79684 RepID=A0A8J6GCU4_MICOH|nr:A-kinase anchor protein 13 [Microtus ochrogaster]